MKTLMDQIAEIDKQLEEGIENPKKSESEILLDEAQTALPPEEEQSEVTQEEVIPESSIEADEEEEEGQPNATGFRKMRLANKEIKKENETLKERLARLEGVVEGQQKVTAPAVQQPIVTQQEEDAEPNPIFTEEHNSWKIRKMEKIQQEQSQKLAAQEAVISITNAKNAIQSLESAYVKEKADYTEAKQFLKDFVTRDAKIEFPTAKEADIAAYVEQMELQAAASAASKGINPAEYFYQKAIVRGYQASKKESETPSIKPGSPNLDAIRKNKERSTSFIGAPSKGTPGKLSSSQLADLTVAQFAQLSDEEKANIR